ncbi:hypothetical protein [uncultured Lamprocystis sp.]|jgi:uncharacterized membrane protein|uniref:hypothetical protein n=1 Tax=uncultured Lamprocystis sp. TaxID=543132 RepID=UPI0025CED90F|nr:hypothetical protein [uncultured Lamprocystis sp.]
MVEVIPPPLPPALPFDPFEPKRWYESRGVIGGLMVVLAQLAQVIGYQVDAAALTDLVLQGVALVGGLLALVGRVQATQPIGRPTP